MFPEGGQTRKHCFLAMFPEVGQTKKHCFLAMFPEGKQTRKRYIIIIKVCTIALNKLVNIVSYIIALGLS
jgi:hypothetical protein